MRFTQTVALIAALGLAIQANAAEGMLRRTLVAQNDSPAAMEAKIVVIPAETAAQSQPTTVVEAQPVADSKAEALRKARQNQEIQTEQKIVEKLEESRLKEEQQRAERLFGDKTDDQSAPAAVLPVAPVTSAPAVAVPAEIKPQQVTIEKIEIVQPVSEKPAAAPVVAAPPLSQTVAESDEQEPEATSTKFYVGGVLAAPTYNASNVKTNYGLGVMAGGVIDRNWSVEGSFIASNYNIDTFWDYNLYKEMDQYDVQAVAKFSFLTGSFKPFIGAGGAYVYRSYKDRLKDPRLLYSYSNSPQSLDTYAINFVAQAGVGFAMNEKITLSAGIDYNKPIMTRNTPRFSDYGLPDNSKPIEEFDYYSVKVGASLSF